MSHFAKLDQTNRVHGSSGFCNNNVIKKKLKIKTFVTDGQKNKKCQALKDIGWRCKSVRQAVAWKQNCSKMG